MSFLLIAINSETGGEKAAVGWERVGPACAQGRTWCVAKPNFQLGLVCCCFTFGVEK